MANANSPFYASSVFDRVIAYATGHYRRCELAETGGKRRMALREVPSVAAACAVLGEILETPVAG